MSDRAESVEIPVEEEFIDGTLLTPDPAAAAPGGGSRSGPYPSTHQARTAVRVASARKASRAATSGPLAPPRRHDDSSTPQRQRPWASRPRATS